MKTTLVTNGCYLVEIPEVELSVLCGCPENAVKFLLRKGLIRSVERGGVSFESGPNAILLSEMPIQNGSFCNLAEFPILQMLYRQGMIVPGHPNNTGRRPMVVGVKDQIDAQSRYIYLGNYGVTSRRELAEVGLSEAEIDELLRLKLWFAFGTFSRPEELLDLRVIDNDAIELRRGAIVQRTGINEYEFLFGGERTTVNLNLAPHERYGAPYVLGYHRYRRERFSVIHLGEGDGFDPRRPCMASLLTHAGALYLIDAGPNIRESLNSMGICVNEITGIFQTHAHDDHFVGLTALLHSDRRIRYYATPLVREAAVRKLCALTSQPEAYFEELFDVHELVPDAWNDVDGLEVMPVASPHPVETTVLFFRARDGSTERTYCHLADIASFAVLNRMTERGSIDAGLTLSQRDRIERHYLEAADIKKIDCGGGMIHGSVDDFENDRSKLIYVSHTSTPPRRSDHRKRRIAEFGASDTLIAARQDYLLLLCRRSLEQYYPAAPSNELDRLLEHPHVPFEPGATIIPAGVEIRELYLIAAGLVEAIDPRSGHATGVSAGFLAGESEFLTGRPSEHTYRAASPLDAIRIPHDAFRDFLERTGLARDAARLAETRTALSALPLFAEMVSVPSLAEIARGTTLEVYGSNERVVANEQSALFLVADGELRLSSGARRIGTARIGDFYGEEQVLYGTSTLIEARTTMPTRLYRVSGDLLGGKPIIMAKLHEAFDRRLKTIRNVFAIEWKPEYTVKVRELDRQHAMLFSKIAGVQRRLGEALPFEGSRSLVDDLIRFARDHFDYEENLLKEHACPGLHVQRREHRALFASVESYEARLVDAAGSPPRYSEDLLAEFVEFLKNWLLRHTLHEDRKYSEPLNARGVT